MTSNPVFSVIIPTYNRARFIDTTIRSVLAQSFENFEIIVVDDGSTDNTGEIVANIADTRLRYLKKPNGERGAARNEGARNAIGSYISFLDSDDTVYTNHLSVAQAFLKKTGDVDVFHIGYDIKDDAGITKKMPAIYDIKKQIIDGNMLSCNGVFIKKETLLNNAFVEDRTLASLEDWELWIRLAARFNFYHIHEVTSTIMLHDARSVVVGNSDKIKSKTDSFIKYVSADPENLTVYGTSLTRTYASVCMYAALHLAMANGKAGEVFPFLRKAIHYNRNSIFTRRFLVTLKLLITG